MISIDTRTLNEGDIYLALKGENHDGHDFVEDAFKRGASAAIVENTYKGEGELIYCDDSYQYLLDLAIEARNSTTATIIGITGSVGKTTTKEMLKFALGSKAYATKGNYNNHIGLPLMLANMTEDCEYGIFEMGMSGAGEIEFLATILQPDISIVTSIAPAHMENFDSLAGIAKAKAEIFSRNEGVAIYPKDVKHVEILREASQYWQQYEVESQSTPNRAVVEKCLEVIGEEQAIIKLDDFSTPQGRGNIVEYQDITIIDDSYNASPESVAMSLQRLANMTSDGRKIAILGDMLELGENSKQYHISLADYIDNIDMLICVGQEMQHLYEVVNIEKRHYADISQISISNFSKGDVILLKGSNSMKLWKIYR